MKAASRLFTNSLVLGLIPTLSLAVGRHGSGGAEEPGRITVRVYYYADVPDGTRTEAAEEATRVLRRAGVKTRWLDCSPAPAEIQRDPACKQRRRATDLIVTILPRAVTARLPPQRRELGVAMLATKVGTFPLYASIYFDRVQELGATGLIPPEAVILGHAMAHEFGHLLLGTQSHSPAGIMHIPWGSQEIVKATQGALLFMPWQAKQMQEQVRQRTSVDQSGGAVVRGAGGTQSDRRDR